MRIKLLKDNRLGRQGEVIEVSKNVAFGLIDSGYGMISKDIVVSDTVKVKKHGKSRNKL